MRRGRRVGPGHRITARDQLALQEAPVGKPEVPQVAAVAVGALLGLEGGPQPRAGRRERAHRGAGLRPPALHADPGSPGLGGVDADEPHLHLAPASGHRGTQGVAVDDGGDHRLERRGGWSGRRLPDRGGAARLRRRHGRHRCGGGRRAAAEQHHGDHRRRAPRASPHAAMVRHGSDADVAPVGARRPGRARGGLRRGVQAGESGGGLRRCADGGSRARDGRAGTSRSRGRSRTRR